MDVLAFRKRELQRPAEIAGADWRRQRQICIVKGKTCPMTDMHTLYQCGAYACAGDPAISLGAMSGAFRVTLVRRRYSFLRDKRGAIAFETLLVYIFMVSSLLLPLADVGVASLQFTHAWAALRSMGQYLQYKTPPVFGTTNISTWETPIPSSIDGYTFNPGTGCTDANMTKVCIICGDSSAVCSSTNTATPQYYSYTTTLTLKPLLLTAILCPSSCTYTLAYSERFQ
jgi:hypothetical protein